MCGRGAQSRAGVAAAAAFLGAPLPPNFEGPANHPHDDNDNDDGNRNDDFESGRNEQGPQDRVGDNLNMAPGMPALVFTKGDDEGAGIVLSEKVWGLVTRKGTKNAPLQEGMGQHFSNLMFNARSDTLYDKRTFRDLALHGKTCVVALQGFYEWKASERSVVNTESGKQPYFVHRSDGQPLLLPGLWTSVPTGRKTENDRDVFLDTFTILTTDSSPQLQWLHSRMPVCLWDKESALAWLTSPSQTSHKKNAIPINRAELSWHPVTKKMSRMNYRQADCIQAIKLEKIPSVKSFFSAAAAAGKSSSRGGGSKKAPSALGTKRSAAIFETKTTTIPTKKIKSSHAPVKKISSNSSTTLPKKGSITSFFAKKT